MADQATFPETSRGCAVTDHLDNATLLPLVPMPENRIDKHGGVPPDHNLKDRPFSVCPARTLARFQIEDKLRLVYRGD